MKAEWIPLFAALVSAIAALVGAAIGATASYLVSRRQYNATAIAQSRQAWINTLRDTVAEFQSLIVPLWHWVGDDAEQAASETYRRTALLVSKLRLLINPHEADHQRLVELAEQAFQLATGPNQGKPNDVGGIQRELTSCTQAILKREWERVKRGR